jgi:sterol 14-demethylase
MQQSYRDGRQLRDHEIAHMMITLLMAGQHTSSSSDSWTLLRLANNPDVAYVVGFLSQRSTLSNFECHNSEALYQEQVKYFGSPDGKLRSMTFEEL